MLAIAPRTAARTAINTGYHTARASILSKLTGALPYLLTLSSLAASRARLGEMAERDEAMLRDIGLTRSEAMDEAARPIWDVPRNWRS